MNIARKNTFFSSIPESKDANNTEEIRVQNASQNKKTNDDELKIDKLLASEEHPFKIVSLTYCDQFDMLSVGLSNGQIVTYTLEIESFVYTNDTDTSISPSDKEQPPKRCKYHMVVCLTWPIS